MNDAKAVTKRTGSYSSQYKAIKKQAESTWPAWKVTIYNASASTSAHAKRVNK